MMKTMPFYITDRLGATLHIDRSLFEQPGALDSARAGLVKAVTREAEANGGMPGPDDFFFETEPGQNFTQMMTATWSPTQATLVGGPNDGEVFPVVRKGWRAIDIWRTRGLPQQASFETIAYPVNPSNTFIYKLAGIDGMRSIWVYEYLPEVSRT